MGTVTTRSRSPTALFGSIGTALLEPFSASAHGVASSGLDGHLPQSERGSFSDVDDLGGSKQGCEGVEVAFEDELSDEAAELHGGLLALAPALPIVPAQIGGHDLDGVGALKKAAEAPIDVGAGDVEVGHFEHAPQHVEGEVAKRGPVVEVVARFDAEGRQKPQGQRSRGKRVGPQNAGVSRFGLDQPEAGTPGAKPASGHALDRYGGVGLEIDGLAEEKEILTRLLPS